MTIRWRTSAAATSRVELGATPTAFMPAAEVPGSRTEHVVRLTGLQPNTKYFYRCGGIAGAGGQTTWAQGAEQWFRTSPAAGSRPDCRFWVLGDSGSHPGAPSGYWESKQVGDTYLSRSQATGKRTDGLILLGDNAYINGSETDYQGALFDKYQPVLKFAPVWSTFGNHDAYTLPYPFTGEAPYDRIFSFPLNGECGGVASGSSRYYSFDHGRVHFVCIDNNTIGYYDTVPGGGGMVDWLIEDLKECTADWIVAFFHHPPYSKGSHDSDTEWNLVRVKDHIVPILERFGVDLVMCGHSHQYERSRFIDGHYGGSTTFQPATMVKSPGNGSERGGVDPTGQFVANPTMAGGAYQKAAAVGRAGAVYVVAGASGKLDAWPGGSTAVGHPSPHPAHCVSLRVIGGLVLEITANRLHAEYWDAAGNVRDDFDILKGSLFELAVPEPGFGPVGEAGARLLLKRSGAISLADSVNVTTLGLAGTCGLAATVPVFFGPGQAVAELTFAAPVIGHDSHIRFGLEGDTRAVEEGAALRRTSQTGDPVELIMASTPAATWYATRLGTPPTSVTDWEQVPDGDGMSMLMTYALGGEPGRNDSDMWPRLSVENGSVVMRYLRPAGRTDLSYSVETAPDLVAWQQQPGLDQADGPPGPAGEPRKIVLPAAQPVGFGRLVVSLVP